MAPDADVVRPAALVNEAVLLPPGVRSALKEISKLDELIRNNLAEATSAVKSGRLADHPTPLNAKQRSVKTAAGTHSRITTGTVRLLRELEQSSEAAALQRESLAKNLRRELRRFSKKLATACDSFGVGSDGERSAGPSDTSAANYKSKEGDLAARSERKPRGRPLSANSAASAAGDHRHSAAHCTVAGETPANFAGQETEHAELQKVPRKRGRPRKRPLPDEKPVSVAGDSVRESDEELSKHPAKRQRRSSTKVLVKSQSVQKGRVQQTTKGKDADAQGKDTTAATTPHDKPAPRYCYCQREYKEGEDMIACDGKDCKYEWFHNDCVNVVKPPRGHWYCPDCTKKKSRARAQ